LSGDIGSAVAHGRETAAMICSIPLGNVNTGGERRQQDLFSMFMSRSAANANGAHDLGIGRFSTSSIGVVSHRSWSGP